MKIGIIVYSETGNTLKVANRLRDELNKKGNNAVIEEIKAIRNKNQTFELNNIPNIDKYEGLIFATFVEAFSLCPIMINYLNNIKSLKNKKIAGFVTQYFPYSWMGGKRAIKQMNNICELKGNKLEINGVINRKNKKCEKHTNNLITDITNYFIR